MRCHNRFSLHLVNEINITRKSYEKFIFDARRVSQSEHSLSVLTLDLCICPKKLNLEPPIWWTSIWWTSIWCNRIWWNRIWWNRIWYFRNSSIFYLRNSFTFLFSCETIFGVWMYPRFFLYPQIFFEFFWYPQIFFGTPRLSSPLIIKELHLECNTYPKYCFDLLVFFGGEGMGGAIREESPRIPSGTHTGYTRTSAV